MLDDRSFVKVNSYLQLIDYKNIFAVGDVNNVLVEKTAQNAEKQARTAIKNILLKEKGKELLKHVNKKNPLVISLGKYNAVFTYNNIVLSGIIPALMKKIIEWKSMLK